MNQPPSLPSGMSFDELIKESISSSVPSLLEKQKRKKKQKNPKIVTVTSLENLGS